MTIVLQSPAFPHNGTIPREHTGEGGDHSPPLVWSNVPKGTRELAILCDDPDAPRPTPWVHWVLYGLRPELERLNRGDNGGGTEGKNTWGTSGYRGPLPPPGHGTHHYHFKIWALREPLGAAAGLTKEELLAAIAGKVLDEGELIGTYERHGEQGGAAMTQ